VDVAGAQLHRHPEQLPDDGIGDGAGLSSTTSSSRPPTSDSPFPPSAYSRAKARAIFSRVDVTMFTRICVAALISSMTCVMVGSSMATVSEVPIRATGMTRCFLA
jgi:hypothetical protein